MLEDNAFDQCGCVAFGILIYIQDGQILSDLDLDTEADHDNLNNILILLLEMFPFINDLLHQDPQLNS